MHRTPAHQTDFARSLRALATESETALWGRLRSRQLEDAKFRRQVALGPYVADLVCIESRLVVECDGGQHADSACDAVRDAWMRGQGWKVLRFWNHEVLQNMEGVLLVIAEALKMRQRRHSPSPQPSPLKGEGAAPLVATAGGITPPPFQGEGGVAPSPSQGEGWGEGEMLAPPPDSISPPR